MNEFLKNEALELIGNSLHEQKLIFFMPSSSQGPEAQRAGICNNPDTVAKVEKFADSAKLPGLEEMKQGKILRTLPGITRASRITDKGKVAMDLEKENEMEFSPGMQSSRQYLVVAPYWSPPKIISW